MSAKKYKVVPMLTEQEILQHDIKCERERTKIAKKIATDNKIQREQHAAVQRKRFK